MRSEIRAEFVTALRANHGRQCRGHEKEGKHVCAFGLLGEMYCEATGDLDGFISSEGDPGTAFVKNREALMRWCGLSTAELCTLLHLNDTDERSFSQIADVVGAWQ